MTDPWPENWTDCRPGELERLAVRLAFRTKVRVALRAAAAALAVAGAAAGGWYTYEAVAGPPDGHDSPPGCCGCGAPRTDAPMTPPTGTK